MQWIITKDKINTGGPFDVESRAYKVWNAPKDTKAQYKECPPEAMEPFKRAFARGLNYEFRLFDDDGELYYEGKCKDLDQQDEESAFAPLDWAEHDAGCTRMDYRKKGEKEWKTL